MFMTYKTSDNAIECRLLSSFWPCNFFHTVAAYMVITMKRAAITECELLSSLLLAVNLQLNEPCYLLLNEIMNSRRILTVLQL